MTGFALLVFGTIVGHVEATDFSGWSGSMRIYFTGYDKPETLTNFPALIVLSNYTGAVFQYADMASAADAGDLRFSDSDRTTELNYELDTWVNGGTSYVWVCVPALTTNDLIYMYWGNDDQTTPPSYTTDGSAWATNYRGVWHLGENVTDEQTTGTHYDSTANGLDATQCNNNVDLGVVGNGQDLDGTGDWIIVQYASPLNMGSIFTWSGWLRFDGTTNLTYNRPISHKTQWDANNGWEVQCNNGSDSDLTCQGSGNSQTTINLGVSWKSHNWYHVAIVFSNASAIMYRDGVRRGNGSINSVGNNTSRLVFGTDADYNEWKWDGMMDEFRIRTGALTSNEIWASHMTMASNSTFQIYGAGGLVVEGNPASFASSTPPYGFMNITAGTTLTCSAPASFVLDGIINYVCAGYKLYTNDTVLAASSTNTSFSYTNRGVDRLVWCWKQDPTGLFRAGLHQGKSNIQNDRSFVITNSAVYDYTPGCMMSEVKADETTYATTNYYNPVTFVTSSWNKTSTTFGYSGEIWLTNGLSYTFGKYFDDGTIVRINDTNILDNGTWNSFATGAYVAVRSGWHSFEVRLYDGTGGKGPSGGTWGNCTGLAYNAVCSNSMAPLSIWNLVRDPGNMTFLRRRSIEDSLFKLGSITVSGGKYTIPVISLAGCDASLTVYSGPVNGYLWYDGWDSTVEHGTISAGTTALVEVPENTNSLLWLVIHLRTDTSVTDFADTFEEYSVPVCLSSTPTASLSLARYGLTNAVFSTELTSIGLAGGSAGLSIQLSSSSNFSSIIRAELVAESLTNTPAQYDEVTLGFLTPGATYFARAAVTNEAGKTNYSSTLSFTMQDSGSAYEVTALSELTSLRPTVGECVILPYQSEPTYYRVLNSRVASLADDGITLNCLSAGGTGVELISGTSTNDFGCLIVQPTPAGSGKVYLFKEVKSTTYTTNWNADTTWECLTGAGTYPRNVDDVAMILLYTNTSLTLNVGTTDVSTVSLAELYVGQFSNVSATVRIQGAPTRNAAINFSRTTTNTATLLITGGAYDSKLFHFYAGGSGSSTLLAWNTGATGLDFDMGYSLDLSDLVARSKNLARVYTMYSDITIPAGSTLRFCNGTPRTQFWSDNQEPNVYIQFNGEGKILGEGTLWMDTAASCTFWANCSYFYGLIRSTANSAARGIDFDQRQATFFLRSSTVSNCALQVAGHVTSALEGRYSVGTAAWGCLHFYGAHGAYANRLPEQELTTSGGFLTFHYETSDWGEGTVQTQLTQKLTVDKGLTAMYMTASASSLHPYNTFTVLSMTNSHKGTFFIDEPHTRNNNTTNRANTTLGGFADVAIGGTGDLASEKYPVVPWIVTRADSATDIIFAGVDATTGIMYRPARLNRALDSITDPLVNVYSPSNAILLTANRTVNALWLNNASYNKHLGNYDLTITSGGLILKGVGTKIGVQGGTTNGTLTFGNTAYVYATETNEATPQSIWSPVTAAKGFVCGYYGTLLLAGDQTGIDDEIVVNNGKLILGSLDGTVKADIDADIRIVSQNSSVEVKVPGTLEKVNILFDDVYEFGGKLILPADKTERCRELYIGDLTTLAPCGTYGATGSGADFIDDVHFSGTGLLEFGDQGSVFIFR